MARCHIAPFGCNNRKHNNMKIAKLAIAAAALAFFAASCAPKADCCGTCQTPTVSK